MIPYRVNATLNFLSFCSNKNKTNYKNVFNLGVGVKTKLVELKTIKKLYVFILIIDKKKTLKLYVFPGNLKDYLF